MRPPAKSASRFADRLIQNVRRSLEDGANLCSINWRYDILLCSKPAYAGDHGNCLAPVPRTPNRTKKASKHPTIAKCNAVGCFPRRHMNVRRQPQLLRAGKILASNDDL